LNMATPVTGIRIPADLLALIDARAIVSFNNSSL